MAKKIAVLTRARQEEALRMALGIILMDDIVDVYVLDRKVEDTEENNMSIEMMKDMEMNMYTNHSENEDMHYMSSAAIADSLLQYDTIIPY
jgi:hypothetical protein